MMGNINGNLYVIVWSQESSVGECGGPGKSSFCECGAQEAVPYVSVGTGKIYLSEI